MSQEWIFALAPVPLVSAAGLLLFAALHDIVARTVPNGVSVLLALTGLGVRIMDNNMVIGLVAAAAVFLSAAICWRRGWLGGADVKLMGAATLAAPSGRALAFVVAMSVSGSVIAVLYLAGGWVARRWRRHDRPLSGKPASFVARAARAELWRLRRGGSLPYACAIAAGFLLIQF